MSDAQDRLRAAATFAGTFVSLSLALEEVMELERENERLRRGGPLLYVKSATFDIDEKIERAEK